MKLIELAAKVGKRKVQEGEIMDFLLDTGEKVSVRSLVKRFEMHPHRAKEILESMYQRELLEKKQESGTWFYFVM